LPEPAAFGVLLAFGARRCENERDFSAEKYPDGKTPNAAGSGYFFFFEAASGSLNRLPEKYSCNIMNVLLVVQYKGAAEASVNPITPTIAGSTYLACTSKLFAMSPESDASIGELFSDGPIESRV